MNIPQEKNSTLDGMQKVMYAKDSDGKFDKYSYGSEVEEFATKTAVTMFEELANSAKNNPKSSPIEYYMYKNRMDIPTLTSIVGMLGFRVKRHLKMSIFKKMSDKLLQRYADVFEIELKELKNGI